MAVTLANRAELRLAFYRLTGTSAFDGALSENETTAGDNVNRYILQGMREAQLWLLNNADQSRWKKVSDPIVWSGSDAEDGGRYWDLPADFLRLYGTSDESALRTPGGFRWGRLIDPLSRNAIGPAYWIENDQLWVGRGANPTDGLVMDYTYLVPELTNDSTAPDFPMDDRELIVAFAAYDFAHHPQFPQPAMVPAITRYLDDQKQRASQRGRRTREPRRMRAKKTVGTRWWF